MPKPNHSSGPPQPRNDRYPHDVLLGPFRADTGPTCVARECPLPAFATFCWGFCRCLLRADTEPSLAAHRRPTASPNPPRIYGRAIPRLTWGVSSQAHSFRHCACSLCVWIRSVSPSFPCSPDDRITSHPVELVGSGHNPSCSRVSGSGWRDHPFSRRVSARGLIRGRRPPGSGEAVAFSFAGEGLSH